MKTFTISFVLFLNLATTRADDQFDIEKVRDQSPLNIPADANTIDFLSSQRHVRHELAFNGSSPY